MYTDLLLANKILKITSLKKPKAMLLAFVFLFLDHVSVGQLNYVPNPSFEKLVGYDNTLFLNYISVAVPWDSLKAGGGGGSIAPSPTTNLGGTVCYQKARTGSFMAGTNFYHSDLSFLKWRGYIQTPLLYSLKTDKSYCVTSYFNLTDRCQYAIDELSIYFDDGSIASIAYREVALANPQIKSPNGVFYSDTMNWMKVQGKFTANGNESYLTIGNFKSQASLTFSLINLGAPGIVADYYVDDVSVIEADLPAYAGRDTVLCTGDSVFIGRPSEIGLECLWFNPSAGSGSIATGGGLWVKPTTTQTYMVQQDVCGLIKTDTIRVQVKPQYNGPGIGLTANTMTACPTTTIGLSIQNNPPVTGSYNWLPLGVYTQTNNFGANALIPQSTAFTLNINNLGQDAFCPFQRTASVSVSVPLYTDTPVLRSNLDPACPQDTILLNLQSPVQGNTVAYQWFPSPAFTFTDNLSAKSIINQSTTYTLNINSSGNNSLCAYTRTLNITVNIADTCFKEPVMPNIFTPNNDDVNDVWSLKFPKGYSLQILAVYDRWGTLIYERNNLEFKIQNLALIAWDGRTNSGEECSAGVYFYILNYTDKNGTVKVVKGNITLIK